MDARSLRTLRARADNLAWHERLLAKEIRRLQAEHARISADLGTVVGQCVAIVKQQQEKTV